MKHYTLTLLAAALLASSTGTLMATEEHYCQEVNHSASGHRQEGHAT